MQRRVRLVTYAWGRAYVDKLLNYTLASVISPGNLPALANEFDCEVVLLTEESLFAHVREHPIARRIEAIAPLHLMALDDLVREPWQYGMTLARALHRGMVNLGDAMTETYFLFLNGDFVLADGSYERLLPHIRAGDRALLSPSYCVNAETVAPLLDGIRRESGAISLAPRAMARMILDSRHNTIRAKTVNQQVVHFRYMDQFYSEVDANTLLGFQMPVSLVAMRPEVALAEINSFWDWGVVYDFCPSKKLTPLGDSDEFLMLELRSKAEHHDSILLGSSPPQAIASRMRGYITQYQVDNAALPLTLHAADTPPAAAAARKSLEQFRDTVLRCLPSAPIDHRNHAQWQIHSHHFAEFGKNPALGRRIARLKKEIAQVRAENEAEEARLRRALRVRLNALENELENVIRSSSLGASASPMAGAAKQAHEGGIGQRVFRLVFGRIPNARPWHPWYLPYKDASAKLHAASRAVQRRYLFACEPMGPLHRAAKELPAHCTTIVPWHLIQKGPAAETRTYDECLMDLLAGDLNEVGPMIDGAFARVKDGGRLTVHVTNLLGESAEHWGALFAERLIGTQFKVRIDSTGSWAGRKAIGAFRRGLVALSTRRMGWPAILGLWILASVVLALIAYFAERSTARDAERTIDNNSTSVTIEIDLTAATYEETPARGIRAPADSLAN